MDIYKIYPNILDYENLSRLKILSKNSDFANDFNYNNIIVNKPWGYEYLWYQNKQVAIWFLKLNYNQSTSLHCHAFKRTSLIVLEGKVQTTTIENKFILNELDSIVIEPCVFHSSKALSENGVCLLEIETPPMKGDLIRMNDTYGRSKQGYERKQDYSTDLAKYDFKVFKKGQIWQNKNIEINWTESLLNIDLHNKSIVSIDSEFKINNSEFEIGEIFKMNEIKDKSQLNKINEFLIFNFYGQK